jgi:hypothetical protein
VKGRQDEECQQPQGAADLHGAHSVDVERLHLGDQVAPVADRVRGDGWSAQIVAARRPQSTRLVVEHLRVGGTADRCAGSIVDGGHTNRLTPAGRSSV